MHDIAPRARHLFIFCLCCEGGLSEGSRCRHLVDQISEINKASFFFFCLPLISSATLGYTINTIMSCT